jgi:hypothetical protein
VVVLGYVVRGPLAGMAWHHLQYAMGLAHLGHDVVYVEDSGDSEWCCYDPQRGINDTDPTYGRRFAAGAFTSVGLGHRWAYHDAHTNRWFGPLAGSAVELCQRADVVLNLSSANPLRPWLRETPLRILVDTDPVFSQVRNLTEPERRELTAQHNRFFTFAHNVGSASCTLPHDGFPWQPTRQPIVLDAWPVAPPPAGAVPYTTVMQWRSYATREHRGIRFGMKADAFGAYLELPRRVRAGLELAIGADAPRDRLRRAGWRLRNPLEISLDLQRYQRYLQESRGEFSIAKQGYVRTRCGWFSERTAAYLASGRPAIVQDTGFADWLGSGEGLWAFADLDGAIAGIEAVEADYERHCRAARDLVAACFDARSVLTSLLERACGSTPTRSFAHDSPLS